MDKLRMGRTLAVASVAAFAVGVFLGALRSVVLDAGVTRTSSAAAKPRERLDRLLSTPPVVQIDAGAVALFTISDGDTVEAVVWILE